MPSSQRSIQLGKEPVATHGAIICDVQLTERPRRGAMRAVLSLFLCISLLSVHHVRAQNFWQQTNGPSGGGVSALAIAPNGSIFVGNNGGGVFRSTDGGESWIQVGLANTYVTVLAIGSNGTIFVGSSGGVFRSTDNGRSWTQAGLANYGGRSLAVSPNGDIYAGAYADVLGVSESVLRSTDDGGTWTVTGLTVDWETIWTLAVNSSGDIFAGAVSGLFESFGGLYRSLDNGKSWTPVTLGLTGTPVHAIAVSPNGDLYSGTNTGVFRSTNNGGNWTKIGSTNVHAGALAVNVNGDVFAGNSSGIFRSTNSGISWTSMNVGLTSTDVTALSISSTGQIFAGTGNGVFRSADNGGSWTRINNGFISSRIQCLGVTSTGQLIAGTKTGLFRSPDNGGTWIAGSTGLTDPDVRSIVASNKGIIYVGTANGVSRSPDSTFDWVSSGLSSFTLYSLAANSSGHVFAGTDSGVFRSTDNGGSWMHVGLAGKAVSAIAIQSGGDVYAGVSIGVFRSTDNGANWIQTGLTNTAVQSLVFSSSGHALAGTSSGVFRSVDNGASWGKLGLTTSLVDAFAVNTTGQVFAGTASDGVFQSLDDGATWSSVSTGLLNLSILSLAISPTGFLFAGSGGGGVFKSVQSTLAILTQPATAVGATSATLTGRVNPSGLTTTAYFEWGTSSTLATVTTTPARSIGSGVVEVVISEDLTVLSPSTMYYFRLVSQNSAGTRKGAILSFSTSSKLPTATTSIASLVTVSSATLSGSVNPNGASTTAYFKWGTTANLATFNSTSAQSIGSGLTDQTVTASLTNLTSNTQYYFRFVAQNSAGSQEGSIASFTTLVAPPGAVLLSTPLAGSTNQLITPTLSWQALAGATRYHLLVSTNSGFLPPLLLEDSTLALTSRQIGPLPFNTIYYWKVSASNGGGTGPFSAAASFTTLPAAPTTITATTTVNFPAKAKRADYALADYRILGLPGVSNLSVGSIVAGTHADDWEAYWDNGNSSDYMVQYDGGATFQFSAGRAFWILSRSTVTIDRTVSAAPLNAAYEAEVPLHPGWNLITNPFTLPIPWSRVQAANNIAATPIYSFNGSFVSSTNLDPYAGYYYFNGSPATTLATLKVPYQAIYANLVDAPTLDAKGWRVSVQLAAGESIDGCMKFGVSATASKGLDDLDVHKPRAIGSLPDISFERPQWDPEFTKFATDIRSPIIDLEQWDFVVKTEQQTRTTLTFSGVGSIPRLYEVILIDRECQQSIDLRKDSIYVRTSTGDRCEMSVVVGSRDLVLRRAAEILPTETTLRQNFPNPFNPTTAISFQLLASGFVSLKIFDVLGREVATLVSEMRQPGAHTVRWDGSALPSGVYYYRLRTEAFDQTRKMILMK